MRIRHVKINNFRGIKQADLTFPLNQRLICLIGPGDSTKSTILAAIHYALWSNWNLSLSSSDFYECNTEESIRIEVSFDEFPDSFLKEQKYGLFLRGSWSSDSDEPTGEDFFLTARLEINDSFEPQWTIVCNRQDSKSFSTADRQLISPGMIGIDFSQNLNWGQGSALARYVDPREIIKRNLSIIEAESRKIGDYSELDDIAPIISIVADGYGVSINGKLNNKVSLKSKNVLSTIELFEGNHRLAMQQKQEEVNTARKMASDGIPIEQIAKEMHHTFKTIQNYLNPSYSVENKHYHARILGKLAPYEAEVIKLRCEGMTYPCIHKIISEKGYEGSVASLRMFIQKERIRCMSSQKEEACSDYHPKEYIQRRSLTQLIYKGLNDVKTISQEQYEQVLKSYPMIADLYVTIKEFYEIIYSKHEEKLDAWLVKLEKFNIPELQTYVNGIRQDIVAVKNGISMQYNNGLAEGSVNKLKVIKRIMYGRNSFELLKAKVLLHEQFRCEIN